MTSDDVKPLGIDPPTTYRRPSATVDPAPPRASGIDARGVHVLATGSNARTELNGPEELPPPATYTVPPIAPAIMLYRTAGKGVFVDHVSVTGLYASTRVVIPASPPESACWPPMTYRMLS